MRTAEDTTRADRPLIGVTTSEVRMAEGVRPTPQGEPPQREMALGLGYMRAVDLAGGIPVVIPPLPVEALVPLLAHMDGVLLSGGPDIDPQAYGQESHRELGPTWPDLDVTELALARRSHEHEIPLLAICRGAQALNVARGGTLFQHLPDVVGRSVQHRQPHPGMAGTHRVTVAEDSVLAGALGEIDLLVNSYHHQSASGLGRGLRAVAWAPDGVIEGVEADDRRFEVGVQWHAEGMLDQPPQQALFSSFVGAAAERAAALREQSVAA